MIKRNLLIVSLKWPEPRASAAGIRMVELISAFKREYQITFSCTAANSEYAEDLGKLGVVSVRIAPNESAFDIFVATLDPEIVLFDRFPAEEQFGWRVAEHAPHALRILDTEDLHSLRSARQKAILSGETGVPDLWVASDLAKREIAAIYRCDLSLIISKAEIKALRDTFGIWGKLLLYVPFLLPQMAVNSLAKLPDYGKRKDFISIGTGKHTPNTDSFLWLSAKIWPLVRKSLPEVSVHIYGAYLPPAVLRLHDPGNGFLVHGWAPDAREVLQKARVCLAPLRFGAGIKGKLVESMVCGTPSVTTPAGMEGLGPEASWGGAVATNAEELAREAVDLYSDRERWEQAQQKGMECINLEFDEKYHRRRMFTRIRRVMDRLDRHRAKNFTGAMLMHHTVASARYLAKWIEEKNRNKPGTLN